MVASASAFVLMFLMAIPGAQAGGPEPVSISGVVVDHQGRPAATSVILAAGSEGEGEPPSLLGRTIAGPEGQFTLTLESDPCLCDRPTLWVYRPGSVVSTVRLDRSAISGSSIRLALGSTSQADFVIAGPDGRPISGARIAPRRIFRDDLIVPGELADLTGSTTDDQGRATITAFRPEELVGVRVEAKGFGSQARDFRERDGHADVRVKGITLIAPGQVAGRVVADEPGAVSGLTVRLSTSIGGREVLEAGFAEAVTDGSGRFSVPFLASGPITVRVRPRSGSADLPARVVRRILEPGQVDQRRDPAPERRPGHGVRS